MKRTTKLIIIVGAGAVLIGLAIGLIALSSCMKNQSADQSGNTMVANIYPVDATFHAIDVDESLSDVRFRLAGDGVCRVECHESQLYRHRVTVQDETLYIRWESETLHHGLLNTVAVPGISRYMVTVYLPQSEYESLRLRNDSGDVDLPADFTFANVTIVGDVSDVLCRAAVTQSLSVEASTGKIKLSGSSPQHLVLVNDTGDISVSKVEAAGTIQIEEDSGSVTLSGVQCCELSAQSGSGEQLYEKVSAAGDIRLESDTGAITLTDCDAANLAITTDSGDITAALLSEKVFYAASDSGRVTVPHTAGGGLCELTSNSGDITAGVK